MELQVAIDQGMLQGRERKGSALFAGIPYAAPPVGQLRFAAPQAALGWEGVRDATAFGLASPQLPGDGLTNAMQTPWDEDSLTLNVLTPAVDGASRPVMVWIHGGDFKNGTGAIPWYDGSSFAAQGDIVVVTINYRMGALGFARLDHLDSSASTSQINGLLDQVAALQWVKDNIAAFGGDPDRVTVAGESAGAFSIGSLLAMPAASGLFHGAILQSGAGHHVLSEAHGQVVADAFLEAAGVSTMDELRALTADQILAAQRAVEEQRPAVGPAQTPFYPSVHAQLPGIPIDLFADGRSAQVPVLLGSNAHETTLFGINQVSDQKLQPMMGRYVDDPAALIDLYRGEMPGANSGALAVAMTSDWTFRIPAVRLAETRHATGGPTWMYFFSWESRAFKGALGATHALEILFTFNNLTVPGADSFMGSGPSAQHVADAMHQAWIAFIQTGDPNTANNPAWPPYEPQARSVLEFGGAMPALLEDPASLQREAWAGLR